MLTNSTQGGFVLVPVQATVFQGEECGDGAEGGQEKRTHWPGSVRRRLLNRWAGQAVAVEDGPHLIGFGNWQFTPNSFYLKLLNLLASHPSPPSPWPAAPCWPVR
jgi:hypothetical protein